MCIYFCKKISLIVLLSFSFLGCSAVKKYKSNPELQSHDFGFNNVLNQCVKQPSRKALAGREVSSDAPSGIKFNFYNSWEEARDSYQNYINENELKDEILEKNNNEEMYTEVTLVVNEVLNTFLKLYPQLQEKLTEKKLHPIIIDSKVSPSYVIVPEKSYEYFLVINRKLIGSVHQKALYGVVAHELTHLLLQNHSSEKEVQFPAHIHYDITKVDLTQPLYNQLEKNETLESSIFQWKSYASFAGEYSFSRLKGVATAYSIAHTPYLDFYYQYITNKTDCLGEHEISLSYLTQFHRYGGLTGISNLSQSDQLLFWKNINENDNRMKTCLGDLKIDFLKELNEFFLEKKYKLNKPVDEKIFLEINVDKRFAQFILDSFNNQIFYQAYSDIVTYARLKMRELEAEIGFENIRLYAKENHADEIAVQVMAEMNINYEYLFKYMNSNNKSIISTCSDGSFDKEPYTPIFLKHQFPCWRYWRAKQLKFD